MKAGFVQNNPVFGAVADNFAAAAAMVRSLDAELVILPELSFTGYLFSSPDEVRALAEPVPQGRCTRELAALARTQGCYLIAGIAESYRGKYYNSSVLVGPRGYIATYRKLHLFNREKLWFAPGDIAPEVHDIGIARIGMMICFDWIFPELMRTLALKGAQVICHCANLVLPFCPDAMITRCLENRVFAVTANRVGSENRGGESLTYIGTSQIVSPQGKVICRSSIHQEETGQAVFNPTQADNKKILEANDLFADRRVEFYRLT